MVGRLHGQACQMTQQRPKGGVRALDCTPRSYGATALQDASPLGQWLFFCRSRSVGSLLTVALRSRSPAPPPNRGLKNPARVAVDPYLWLQSNRLKMTLISDCSKNEISRCLKIIDYWTPATTRLTDEFPTLWE